MSPVVKMSDFRNQLKALLAKADAYVYFSCRCDTESMCSILLLTLEQNNPVLLFSGVSP